jgi:hypothetical protein
MKDDISDVILRIYNDVGNWTDERGYNFIKELILSGDVYTVQRQSSLIKTENEYPSNNKYDLDFANLWCYEPYKGKRELQENFDKAQEELGKLDAEIIFLKSDLQKATDALKQVISPTREVKTINVKRVLKELGEI